MIMIGSFRLRDLRIGVRMALGLFALLLLTIAMIGFVIFQLERGKALEAESTAGLMERRELIEQAKEGLLEAAVAVRNIGLVLEVDATQREEKVAKEKREKLAAALAQLSQRLKQPESVSVLEEIRRLDKQMDPPLREALDLAMAFNPDGAGKVIASRIDPIYQQALLRMHRLVELELQYSQQVAAERESAARATSAILLAGCCATIVLSGLLGWWLTRSVTVPIRHAAEIAGAVARGDLTQTIRVESRDEAGELMASLQQMSSMLKTMLGQVQSSADSIAVATQEVAAGNTDLANRTEDAASQTQATVAVIEELGQTVKVNADCARAATELAQSASGVAVTGGQIVAEVVVTMARITDASRKIADIIALIDSIAFQTNILALNAAVEAARAGEQGRGFSVVASEVRSLAHRSSEAAREIKVLIGASAETVEAGSGLVQKAGSAMDQIVAAVQEFREVVDRVSAASSRQSEGVAQVIEAIAKIDDATQRNAALVEQAAAASSSLERQAVNLRSAIATFQV